MDFLAVMLCLFHGGRVRRSTWLPGCYVYINPQGIMMFYSAERDLEYPDKLDWQDMTARDWSKI